MTAYIFSLRLFFVGQLVLASTLVLRVRPALNVA